MRPDARERTAVLLEVAARLAPDELELLVLIARRLDAGRARDGGMELEQDGRDFQEEGRDELLVGGHVVTRRWGRIRTGAHRLDVAESLRGGALPAREGGGDPHATQVLRSASGRGSQSDPDPARTTELEPRLLVAIPRGDSEEVRIMLSRFTGQPLCDVRLWRRRRDGEWIPERRGISLRAGELAAVADGLRAATVALQEQTRDDGQSEERRT